MSNNPMAGRLSGGLIGLVGGLVTALAYFGLPVISLSFVGSTTAPTLARFAPWASSLIVMSAVPYLAAAAIVVGAWMLSARPSGRARTIGAVVSFVCSALIVLAYLIPFTRLRHELDNNGVASFGINATTFTGSGFWVAVLGAILVAAGGAITLTGARSRPPVDA